VAVAGGDPEGERLPVEARAALPVLAPVPGHAPPPRPGACAAPHGHGAHVAGAAHVADQHQVEVGVAVHGEAHAAPPPAGHPAVGDGDDAGAVPGDAEERRLRQVEVPQRRVAPPAGAAGERVVGRAEVGGRHHDGAARRARPAAAGAPQLEARAAAQTAAE
jgi:hypothetical protein